MVVQRFSSVPKMARFLGISPEEARRLLEEGRMAGALIGALRARGVEPTPAVKNAVEQAVRKLEAELRPRDSATGTAAENFTGTVTIMFTDLVDSTTMTERLGDRRARQLLRLHDDIIRRHTKAYGGTEVKSMGDGFMLTFPSALAAVSCAVAIQRALAQHNREHPEAALRVRMGLSVGEPVREEGDLYGMAVIKAARISALADGGQVLISDIVRALVSGADGLEFRAVGSFQLKGISGLHPLFEVVWEGRRGTSSPTTLEKKP